MSYRKKNIILCSDGTGNTIVKGRGTNVWKLYESIDLNGHRTNPKIPEQVAFYDDGVGTSRFSPLRLLGMAFGLGLKRNVKDLYKSLCRCYEEGDRIYLFGFSRGGYTVRLLAGLIISCGIIRRDKWESDEELDALSEQAYAAFHKYFRYGMLNTDPKKAVIAARQAQEESKKEKTGDDKDNSSPCAEGDEETRKFREASSISPDTPVEIQFLGVWDTVAAVGLPFKEAADIWNRFIYPFMFPDYKLSQFVRKGCHALAIDDERNTFHPMLWDEKDEPQEKEHPRIEQVWFPGVHSNVGGGYPKQGLSLVSLDWMMNHAEAADLYFIPSERERYKRLQNYHDQLYDSRQGLGIFYRYRPRDIEKFCNAFQVDPKIHISTFERIALATQNYAPGNASPRFKIVGSQLPCNEDPSQQDLYESLAEVLQDDPENHLFENQKHLRKKRRLGYTALTTVSLLAIGFGVYYHWNDLDACFYLEWVNWIGSFFEQIPFANILFNYMLKPLLHFWGAGTIAGIIVVGSLILCRRVGALQRANHAKYWRNKLTPKMLRKVEK